MSDEKNVANTQTQRPTDTVSSEAVRKAEDVAQKKRDALSYAENYRQKLRDEKAQRQSPARRKADQEKLENKEREREERRRKMEEMLHSERSAVAERNAQSDEVMQAVNEAEAERRQEQDAAKVREQEAQAAREQQKAAEEAARRQAEEQKAAEEAARRQAEEQERQAAEQAAREQAKQQARQTAEEQARAQAEARRAAEEAAREQAKQQAAEQARKVAEEAARKQAEEEARLAEEKAAEEAAEQVRKIVETVEAERAAEKAAAEAERAEARRAAAEKLAAERAAEEEKRAAEEAARKQAEEDERAEAERAEAERAAAAEQAKAERAAHNEALYTEASEMAGQRADAALAAAKQKTPVVAHPVHKPQRTSTARSPLSADEDLRAERAMARQAALARVRFEKAERAAQGDTTPAPAPAPAPVPAPAAPIDAYTKESFADTPASVRPSVNRTAENAPMSDGGYAPYDDVYHVPYQAPAYEDAYEDSFAYEQDARSAQAAVREARAAEKRAKRAMRDAERFAAYDEEDEVDYEAERQQVPAAAYLPMPEESVLAEDADIAPSQVIEEEKQVRRNDRKARKMVRKVIADKKELHKSEKAVSRKIKKETKRSEAAGRELQAQTAKAERDLAKASKRERAAEKRVERAQQNVDRLTQKQTAMEQKHAVKLAKRPRLAAKLNAREEALAKDIVSAYKQVDRAARQEEKKAQKTLQAQAKLARAQAKQERVQNKSDRRIACMQRAEEQIARKTAAYNRKAERKLSKNAVAVDQAAARENVTLYKGELPRSLHSVSSRQLSYEQRRLKTGEQTMREAELALQAQTKKTKQVARAERELTDAQAKQKKYDKKTAKQQKKVDRLAKKQQRIEERDRLLLERDPSLAPKLAKKESAMERQVSKAQKKLYAAERRQDRFEKKHVDPAHERLMRAEDKQAAQYRVQAKRMIRAKNRSDHDAYRTDRKKIERRNLEEQRRESNAYAAIDAAELAALGTQTTVNSRKIRVLKRQAKEAQAQERAAQVTAERSRRALDKATAKNVVKNHKNERIVARNPKAYAKVVKETEKNRRRLEVMEREVARDERRLMKAARRSENATSKLDAALGKNHETNGAVLSYYDRTSERPYVAQDPTLQKQLLREKKRETARMTKEDRAYARLDRQMASDVKTTGYTEDRYAKDPYADVLEFALATQASTNDRATATAPTVIDKRRVRSLKRQAKKAQAEERAAETQVAHSRRAFDKALSDDAVQNEKNERTVARNPKTYGRVAKEAAKSRRRLEAMERDVDLDERRLHKARQASQNIANKLDVALGRQPSATVMPYDEPIAAHAYTAQDPKQQKKLRDMQREALRASKEERKNAKKEQPLEARLDRQRASDVKTTGYTEDRYAKDPYADVLEFALATQASTNDRATATAPTVIDKRRVRSLKRQAKKAQAEERAAETQVAHSRRAFDKALSDDAVQNEKNERTVARNPKTYGRVAKEAAKSRRRLEAMERDVDLDERRLHKARQASQNIANKLDVALGRQPSATVMPYDEPIAAHAYTAQDPKQQKKLRDMQREALRASKEERKNAKKEQSLEARTSVPLATDYIIDAKQVKKDNKSTRKTMDRLDRLYDERLRLEQRAARTSDANDLVRLVNLQKEICDEYFLILRGYASAADASATRTAEEASAEIRRYNSYITRLNEASGKFFAYAKLSTPYAILDRQRYTPIRLITLKGAKPDRKAEAVVEENVPSSNVVFETYPEPKADVSYRYDKAEKPAAPTMTKREFSAYVNNILQTNVGIEKEISIIRKQQRKLKDHALLRSQTELLCQQKEILDNYIRIFSVAHESGFSRGAKRLIPNAKRHIRVYNTEMKQLETLDGTRHARVDVSLPDRVLAGKEYPEIPSVVCIMPGSKTALDRYALNGNYSDIDRAAVESRFNYRIAALTNSLKDDRYDYVLFAKQGRYTKRQKRKLLTRTTDDRKLALAAEESDNRRYDALVNYEPIEKGRRGRRTNNRTMLSLRDEVKELLAKRDDLNRELLGLYSLMETGSPMKATEQYEDGTLGLRKKLRGKDDPYIVQQQGYLTKRGKQTYSPDLEYARLFNDEKRRQYNKNMKEVAKIRKLRLSDKHPDVRALFSLYNRRVDLITTINTADRKVGIYGYKGKAAATVEKEKKAAIKELRRVDKEIKGRTARARKESRRRPKPFWA